jgi:hypothetical protein
VPSDLVIAVASRIVPGDIVQKLVLLAVFVLACAGAAALLDREPLLARLAGGVFYAWNRTSASVSSSASGRCCSATPACPGY